MTNRKLSVKNLECHLQDLEDFAKPQVHLEQYATPPHIAALMLNTIELTYGDIADKIVADLGCGTGRLTVGSLLCGASMVVGFDLDRSALNSALRNIQQMFCDDSQSDLTPIDVYRDCERFNLVQVDVANQQQQNDSHWCLTERNFDTVIMNPPFGTKQNQGLDLLFLRRAISMSNNVVYSLHKTSTREVSVSLVSCSCCHHRNSLTLLQHIASKCDQWQVRGKPIAQIKYNLDKSYKFHRKRSVDIDVDLWRVLIKAR